MPAAQNDVLSDLVRFLDASPTPFHACRETAARLEANGFRKLDERDPLRLTPGARAYAVRSGSLVAFVAGKKPPAEAGFVMLGAHTDSPNLRLKPLPGFASAGFRQLAIEPYGGVLYSTWLDRELGLAGRVVLRGGSSELVRIDRPVAVIPNLAIHLNREVNKDGLVLNAEKHLHPIIGLDADATPDFDALLVEALAGTPARGAARNDIVGFDLCLFDVRGAAFGGAVGELLHSARLDNLVSCHAACQALISAGPETDATRVVALFDHEEVGSQSTVGARSELLRGLLERVAGGYDGAGSDAWPRAAARSFFVSVDMAHGVHPNYPDKHDKHHRPLLGKGPVVKVNVNQSYATDGVAQGAFVDACRAEDCEPQFFAARNDIPCGSTIGPITAARLGVRTIDVGNPMLAMHSCRETAASSDALAMVRVLRRLLVEPPKFSAI
ncbi:MAG TPA: M18 family aminopeptidase [Polyangiaceae bacterium]